MDKEFHEYAHNIARNYNTEDYEDIYQQAWVYLLEAKESGLKGVECFWDARFRSNLWSNYKNRLVTLPMRTGSKELADTQEMDFEIHDHTITTNDHAEAYETYSEIQYLRKNMEKLNSRELGLLKEVYADGLSFRDLASKYGQSNEMWRKYHNKIISKLKSCQEKN